MKKHHSCITLTLSAFLCFIFHSVLYGQQIICKPMPFLDDLSLNSIFTLYQDESGYIWIGTSDGVTRYDGYSLQRFSNNFKQPALLTNNDIRCFTEDDYYIWAGTTEGITLIDKQNFHTLPFPDSKVQGEVVRDLFRDHQGRIWVGGGSIIYRCNSMQGVEMSYTLPCRSNTFFEDSEQQLWVVGTEGYILYYDEQADRFISLPRCGSSNIYRMIQDHEGRYWLVTWGDGLWSFNPQSTDKASMFQEQPIINPVRGLPEKVFYDIMQDDTYGYFWALSHFRLYILRVNERGELEEVKDGGLLQSNQPIDPYKTYSKIIKDRAGSLWIGAFDQGYTICFEQKEVENFVIKDMNKILGLDPNIIYLNKDAQGIIWFDQARFGLSLYDERTGRATYGIVKNSSLYNIDVRAILPSRDGSFMWLGGREAYSNKVWRATEQDMNISLLEEIDLNQQIEDAGELVQIAEDTAGNLYVATTNHLLYRPAGAKEMRSLPYPLRYIVDMSMNVEGDIFVCCKEKVYWVKDEDLKKKSDGLNFDLQPQLLAGEKLKSSCIDCNGQLWIATTLGRLLLLNPTDGQVTDQTEASGLTGDDILKILSDGKEWLYVVCSKYIVRRHLEGIYENFVYSVKDANIFITSFRYGAAFVDADGFLYAGGHKGFIKINGSSQQQEKAALKVCITDIKAAGHSLLFEPVTENSCKEVSILPNQRNIEIHFSSFQYKALHRVKYAYRLDGMDREWTIVEGGKNIAFYNQLSKGHYTFRVKSTDASGRWVDNEQTLTLVRLPAWYETWVAYTIYTLFVLFLIVIASRAYSRNLQVRNRIRLQKELAQIKINYFTSISHELLTPLTVISCASDALRMGRLDEDNQIGILQSNVSRLKRLIQQVLDFWKMENSKMKLCVKNVNISTTIQGIVAGNFQVLAHRKGIRLITQIEEGIYGYLDCDKLDKILFNLLSNAIKYTPEGKRVHLIVETTFDQGANRRLNIRIADEGIGIEPDELPKIFTKFYNHPNREGYESNGIGLALTKELVILHHGSIEVKSDPGRGSIFQVELPIVPEAYLPEERSGNAVIDEQRPAKLEVHTAHSDESTQLTAVVKPTVLFIDDNTDLLELMNSLFSEQQKVLTATSGEEGIAMLGIYSVDIIVCDLMMPGISGTQLCEAVKQNPQTGHIPIIMLTAKHSAEDRIESYRMGADSYITKPFDMKVLQARIDNLLQVCKQRREAFQADTEMSLQGIDYPTPDKEFLQQAIHCVEQHVQDSDFDIVQMASELCMSRSTLSRKLKVLTGLTPLDFVRNIKLKHACTLLKTRMGVAEVAYSIGLSSPKYFSKCFKEAFGLTPSDYQAQSFADTDTQEKGS
ncbi:hybrid sensor histidine kinase/response regulator transcription factor [Bacteroides intestinalis]|jgi:signal transduction histidine kinase/DNA-binding response OmpR family regulator/ligand-binding sensor domain-containing protein|uniref:histidine kinase n=1 Tax=Bacteroides intestinalis TaxID=329854 RepID=A0A414L3N0_9BACE|nr:hybrid sensor histidine kinase/response regulator transcription factor [Bacteroides intestinalis]RHE89214.1 hybrid sensor histidine kinase/response regulator [Bacteroides intestinalis]